MPRGWLKHNNRTVGRKTGRGGSSRRPTETTKKTECSSEKDRLHPSTKKKRNIPLMIDDFFAEEYDDFYEYFDDEEYSTDNSSSQTEIGIISKEDEEESEVKQCPICYEDRPLIPLMRNCTHEPACQQCLREIFVKQAQENVSNYPLLCYHPSCRKPVHDAQLLLHKLVRSEKEIKKHYRLKTLGQVYSQRKKLVHCPACEEPAAVSKTYHNVTCRLCKIPFHVTHEGESSTVTTIIAMANFKYDKIGKNEGVAHCPECNMLISKGDGCDHMRCFCGHDFSWDEAKAKLKIPRVAMAKHISNTN